METKMACPIKDKLERTLIDVRTCARRLGLVFTLKEIQAIEAVKDHEHYGHDGDPCPGD